MLFLHPCKPEQGEPLLWYTACFTHLLSTKSRLLRHRSSCQYLLTLKNTRASSNIKSAENIFSVGVWEGKVSDYFFLLKSTLILLPVGLPNLPVLSFSLSQCTSEGGARLCQNHSTHEKRSNRFSFGKSVKKQWLWIGKGKFNTITLRIQITVWGEQSQGHTLPVEPHYWTVLTTASWRTATAAQYPSSPA